MTPAEIQQTLQSGIAALKRGEKDAARELLLQVVDADENNETAWLWLSAALDSPDDQIFALENVLALNPDNAMAQKGLSQLRLSQSQRPSPVSTPPPSIKEETPAFSDPSLGPGLGGGDLITDEEALTSPPPAMFEREEDIHLTPLESVSALDDPYQCLYCGAPALAELQRCPECRRKLVVREGNTQLSNQLRTAALALMACIGLAAFEALVVAIFYYQGDFFGSYIYDNLPAFNSLVGDFRLWSPMAAVIVLWLQFVVLGLLILLLLGLLYQITFAYYASIGLVCLNILWMVVRWRLGFFEPALAIIDIFLSFVALFFIFAAQPDFQVNVTRLRCAIDPHVKGGDSLNRLGHIAKGKEQWALAVAYWRAAVAAMPNQSGFYKDLAIGYAQTGYYNRALKALDEFARQAPDSSDFAPMQALIQQKRAQDPHPRD